MNQIETLNNHIAHVHKNSTLFKEKFGNTTEDELNWQPNSETWSVGLCIEHIIKSNFVYFELFEELVSKQYQHRFYEKLPFLPNLFGSLILNACKPETTKRNKTLKVFEPEHSHVPITVLKKFCDNNTLMIEYFEKMKSLPKLDIIITSPASKLIVMPLKTVFEILIFHELRHFNQAERVLTLYRTQGVQI